MPFKLHNLKDLVLTTSIFRPALLPIFRVFELNSWLGPPTRDGHEKDTRNEDGCYKDINRSSCNIVMTCRWHSKNHHEKRLAKAKTADDVFVKF